jgi:phosphatidylserine/phosphatidylglycerophosphate/cardiolipin synthase-like enzyme
MGHVRQYLESFPRRALMARRPASQRRAGAATPGRILLALLALFCVYLYQSGAIQRWLDIRAGSTAPQPADAATGGLQVFFTTTTLVYPDVSRQRTPPPLLKAVLADIAAARKSVDLATFDFDIVEVTDALLGAKQRGVAVRVIVDSENLQTPEVAQQTGRLERAHIPVLFDNREPFMHNKFIVVDGAIAWMGSWNVTTNDTWRNNNNMLRFVSRQIAADYTHEFEQMFGGRFGTSKTSGTPHRRVQVGAATVEVYFSPEDGVAKYVLQRLAAARRSIHFMTFSYTADAISDAMIAKVKAGLRVRGVFERQNANGSGADFNRLQQGGVDVLRDGNCYILHHKVIIIDARTVITGSYNFTSSAEKDNDENLVIVDDPNLARAYLDEFERVYAQAQAPARCR